MRLIVPFRLEQARLRSGKYGSKSGDWHGAFQLLGPDGDTRLAILSSGTGRMAEGWEHVSVSTAHRVPTWDEMCFVKALFWRDDECVVQYHPAKADYVNHHPYCLHMWRPLNAVIPTPPPDFVGPRPE